MILARQRGDQLVNNCTNRTRCFNLSHGHRLIDFKSCSYDRLFPHHGPTERTSDLPPNCLGHANLAIKRWQKSECVGAKFDLGTNTRVFRMSVQLVSHEPGRQCHYTKPVPVAEQRAIVFDVLSGVIVVAVLLDELTDVAYPFAEISIQIDEGNTKARREKRTRRALAGTAGPN